MIEYDKRTLGELFSNPIRGENDSCFTVPRFQRKYEWEKEREVLRLTQDLFDNLGRTYFMGPVIFCSKPDDTSSVEIIDGQQRLVTFALLHRAFVDYVQNRRDAGAFTEDLRPYVEELQSALRSKITRGWMKKREATMRLSKVINKTFRDEIVLDENPGKIEKMRVPAKGEHPSVKRLRAAYVKVFESLGEQCDSLEGEELLNRLRDIAASLEYRQIFLSITVQDYSDAYTIFETINERGRRLTLSDLVKNLCFRKLHDLGEELLDEFENDWDQAESLVSDFGSFIWHVWISRKGTCPKSRVFSEVERAVDRMSGEAVWEFASAMIFDEASWYHSYENPVEEAEASEPAKRRTRLLQMLKAMGATRCYPLLLAIDFAEKKARSISSAQANEMIEAIAALTFWHTGVCESDAKQLEKTYHELAVSTRSIQSQEASEAVARIRSTLYSQFPSASQCRASFTTRTFTNATFVKMALRNMELQCFPGEKALRSDRVVWLEHILPRTPHKDSPWAEVFPDDIERNEYTYRFGNYALLLDRLNERARNSPFSKKKEIYAESQIGLTLKLANAERWDSAAIEQRTQELFEVARKVWPICS